MKIMDAKRTEHLRSFKLELGKALMSAISYNGPWSFQVKKKLETLAPDIYFLAHAIVDKRVGAEVLEMFKNEATKSCESCNDTKKMLEEQIKLTKELKAAVDQLTGMVNKMAKSNVFKSFNYLNEDKEQAESASKKRKADDEDLTVPSQIPATTAISAASFPADFREALSSSKGILLPSKSSANSQQKSNRCNRSVAVSNQQTPGKKSRYGAKDKDGFIMVTGKKNNNFKRNFKPLVIGKSASNDINFRSVPRKFHYCVGRIPLGLEIETFKNYLSEKIKGEIFVENINLNHNYFKLFKVSVDETFDKVMCDPETWPELITVRRYFFRSNKASPDSLGSQPLTSTEAAFSLSAPGAKTQLLTCNVPSTIVGGKQVGQIDAMASNSVFVL